MHHSQKFNVCISTHIGPRDENQDSASVFINDKNGRHIYNKDETEEPFHLECENCDLFALVADGMGGLKRGSKASKMTIDAILKSLLNSSTESVHEIIDSVHDIIIDASEKLKVSIPESGSTIVMAMIIDGHLHIFHVGDSRCYARSNDGEITRTKDHSPVDSLLASGLITEEEVGNHPMRNIISNRIGGDVKVEYTGLLDDWGHIMLCSDGVHSCLSSKELDEIMLASTDAGSVIRRCLSADIQDNATCITVTRTQ